GAERVVEDPEVAVATAQHGLGHDGLHLLRHDADVGARAVVIAEAIEAEAVVEPAEQADVVLQRDVGAPAAAAAAESTAATAAESAATATAGTATACRYAGRSTATAGALAAA